MSTPSGGSTDLARPWGERLRTWREEIKGWSRDEFVQHVVAAAFQTNEPRGQDLGERLVARWESGATQRPQGVYRRLLAHLGAPLPAPPARSAPLLPPERLDAPAVQRDDDEVDRRDFLRAAGAVGVTVLAAGAEPWQRLQEALTGATRPDTLTADAVADRTAALFDLEERAPAREVVAEATTHLNRVTDLIQTADPTLRGRLIGQAGTSAALAGWLAFDQGHGDVAQNYYDVAERAAEEAGDPALRACVRTYRSYLADSRGEQRNGAELLTAAIEVVPRGGDQAVMQAWLWARQAETATALGDRETALRAFDRAFVAHDLASGEQAMWTRFFTPARLDGMAVAAYARLNHPDMDAVAARLTATAGDQQTKVQQIALADLAYAYLERGDVERGAELGQRALDAITQSATRVGYDRLAVIARALAPYRNARAASGLRDQLAVTLRT